MQAATEKQMACLVDLVDRAITETMARAMKPAQRVTMGKVAEALRADTLAQAARSKARASDLIDIARDGLQGIGREVVGTAHWAAYVAKHGS